MKRLSRKGKSRLGMPVGEKRAGEKSPF